MTKAKATKAPRPMPTDPADLARAMFAVADKKIESRKRKGGAQTSLTREKT